MTHLSFVLTADGSKTLFNEKVGEHYHSRHGALQESIHVFLKSGLLFYLDKNKANKASILEVGFGTGLNFLVTADYCTKNDIPIHYTGIEAYPLDEKMITETGYNDYVSPEVWESFLKNYPAALSKPVQINPDRSLFIANSTLMNFRSEHLFDVVYFDAFAAIHQPEMWTIESLSHLCNYLKPGGIFVTYAITGELKRTMKSIGFSIEKAPGAPGKREMLRAVKS
ncbi:tRNA (5-methylaminomethyl-2-thiouridine)(34)-methyltransferase MnmD [Daejeonella sp. H1SJ63]|jgi:tRNA U34 5-methylaminomethyl-2-thiouridine-forming methyltransferase MnmC|uniref:tRNA (5-methylaminomethyl-2-thiouridine)(34)-methyltransferase MnmD n=1 Tax=Daejeonella sp. H1SJ63 TaxID=3034145 RepID=UPI0023EB1BB9|nr:tRNA (5-methylaminomethyl-2-thiouridine)(34)-methyltransferase MnmD [Daejeonella sp. H1SJ63]